MGNSWAISCELFQKIILRKERIGLGWTGSYQI